MIETPPSALNRQRLEIPLQAAGITSLWPFTLQAVMVLRGENTWKQKAK
jgi:hypothetical protein